MQTLEYKEWRLAFDAERTRRAYAKLESGSSEQCGCAYCRNFAAVRSQAYPSEVLDLFDRLGVDPRKEAESYQTHREQSGRHFYGWWLHFVGRIVAGRDVKVPADENTSRLELASLTDDHAIGFTEQIQLAKEPFGGASLVQIEFTAYLPWVLEEVEEPE